MRRTWDSNFGLWPRLAFRISLGFTTLFLAFLILGEWTLRESMNNLLNERLIIAQTTANQIDAMLHEAIIDLELAYRLTESFPRHQAGSNLGSDPDNPFIFNMVRLDGEGVVEASSPDSRHPPGTDLSGNANVSASVRLHRATISEPFVDPQTGFLGVEVIVPIYDGNRLIGLESGYVNLTSSAFIEPLRQVAALGDTGHASLVDADGRTLASTYDLEPLTPGEHATFYKAAWQAGKPQIATVPFEIELPDEDIGEMHVMAYAPLDLAPWGVAVGGDEDETFFGVRRLRWGIFILGTITLVTVWGATLIGTRRFLRPVHELTHAAQQIDQGRLDTTLNISQTGEIGAMATALEHMRLKLIASLEQLADLNENLETRVKEQTTHLRQQQALTRQLLRRAITAQEDERARLSRELHDEIGQVLTALEISIDRLIHALPSGEPEAMEQLQKMRALTDQAIIDLRRMVTALRPGVLDELGLIAALDWISTHMLRPLGVNVSLQVEGMDDRLPNEIETVLFRIAQEAMSNVARHSQAKNLIVRLEKGRDQVIMTLSDDGQGLDPTRPPAASDFTRGLGLAGMRERASLVRGQVSIESAAGKGTTVQVIIPMPDSVPPDQNE